MAVGVVLDNLGDGGGDRAVETCVIPKGSFELCRLVSYIEMGHHIPCFKGKQQVYEQGKRKGEIKDSEMMLHLVFEYTNAQYTGDFPLCIKCSTPLGDTGDLMNKLSIGRGLEEGWLSRSNALKSNFVKTLMAMQDATDCTYPSLADYVGAVFATTVTHGLGKKARDDGSIPVYANMKTTSIVAPKFKDPTGKETVYDLPEVIGTYCPTFEWGNPDMNAWALVPEYLKKFIMKAEDYPGSPLEMLLAGYTQEDAGTAPAEQEPDDAPSDTSAPVHQEEPEDDIPF